MKKTMCFIIAIIMIIHFPMIVCGESINNNYNYKSIINHPKPIVRNSRIIGFTIGGVIGIPLAIIALPITGIMYAKMRKERPYSNEDGEGIIFMIPLAIIGEIVGSITGGIAWLFFGWWGKKVKQLKTKIANELLTLEQTDAA